ncbi:MAG: hypothetical protein DI598_11930 [Pseudopedobacter saltans]|uniref:Uncharacterized protein n=1 Tax=Pseudopedobacter saltans TaxID=151895 RepID=A0A2W5EVU6_9SPHI|nr:MAG: hypothetical protein DI598_11930 [Pseudopedobacter saltans]
MMMPGGSEFIIIALFSLIPIAIGLVIAYFVIRGAVKSAIKDQLGEINENLRIVAHSLRRKDSN